MQDVENKVRAFYNLPEDVLAKNASAPSTEASGTDIHGEEEE